MFVSAYRVCVYICLCVVICYFVVVIGCLLFFVGLFIYGVRCSIVFILTSLTMIVMFFLSFWLPFVDYLVHYYPFLSYALVFLIPPVVVHSKPVSERKIISYAQTIEFYEDRDKYERMNIRNRESLKIGEEKYITTSAQHI